MLGKVDSQDRQRAKKIGTLVGKPGQADSQGAMEGM